jgi:hypothetical protein
MTKINFVVPLLALGVCWVCGCATTPLGVSNQSLETIPETMATSVEAFPDQDPPLTPEAHQALADAAGLESLSQSSFGEAPVPDAATQVAYQEEIAPTQPNAQVANRQIQGPGGQRRDGATSGFPDQGGQSGFGPQGRPQPGRPGFGGHHRPGHPGGFGTPARLNANVFVPGVAPLIAGQGSSQATVVLPSTSPPGMPMQPTLGVPPMAQDPPPIIPPNDPRGRITQVPVSNYNSYSPGAVSIYGDQVRQPQMTANEVTLQLQDINQQLHSEIHTLQEELAALQKKYDAEHELRIETDKKLASANQLNSELKRMAAQLGAQNERLAREKADIKRRADDALRQIESNLDSVIMNSLSKSIKQ